MTLVYIDALVGTDRLTKAVLIIIKVDCVLHKESVKIKERNELRPNSLRMIDWKVLIFLYILGLQLPGAAALNTAALRLPGQTGAGCVLLVSNLSEEVNCCILLLVMLLVIVAARCK